MNIFTNGKGLSAKPAVNPGFDNWMSLGCYTDSLGERTLDFRANVDGINTAVRCASACQQAGYTYAGMEYGQGPSPDLALDCLVIKLTIFRMLLW